MQRTHRSVLVKRRTTVLLLIILALLAATIVETMSAAELGASLEPADYLFTLMILVIPVVGWSWAGSRASTRAGRLAMASGVITAAGWVIHAAVVWSVAHGSSEVITDLIAWPAFWLPVIPYLPLVYCVPQSGDSAVMKPWLRRLGVVAVVSVAVVAVAQALSPDMLDGNYNGVVAVVNPLGIDSFTDLVGPLTFAGVIVLSVFALAGLLDGLRRLQRGGEGAEGLRPVVMVVGIAALLLALLVTGSLVLGEAGFTGLWVLAVGILIAVMIAATIRASSVTARARRAEVRRRAAAEARAEEGRILRRDLHDGVGPAIAAIGIRLDILADQMPGDTEAALSLQGARVAVDSARAELRSIVDGLRPPLLDELGFLAALEARCLALDHSAGRTRVRVHFDGILGEIPDSVALALITASGEATSNAVQHSGGTTCVVKVSRVGGVLSVQIADDGVWRGENRSGHGLHTMQERIEELGGTFEIDKTTSGTTIGFTVDLS